MNTPHPQLNNKRDKISVNCAYNVTWSRMCPLRYYSQSKSSSNRWMASHRQYEFCPSSYSRADVFWMVSTSSKLKRISWDTLILKIVFWYTKHEYFLLQQAGYVVDSEYFFKTSQEFIGHFCPKILLLHVKTWEIRGLTPPHMSKLAMRFFSACGYDNQDNC